MSVNLIRNMSTEYKKVSENCFDHRSLQNWKTWKTSLKSTLQSSPRPSYSLFQPKLQLMLSVCSNIFGSYCEMSRQETIALKSVRLWSGQNYMCSSSTDDPMLRLCRQFT